MDIYCSKYKLRVPGKLSWIILIYSGYEVVKHVVRWLAEEVAAISGEAAASVPRGTHLFSTIKLRDI